MGETLLDEALGDGFAIVTRTPDPAQAFDPETRAFFAALGTTIVPIGADAHADALLLRPDRVVAASADRADLRSWRRLLESAGIAPQEVSS